jgi:predicted  nucleic acid-binding Zn-ribbon protein
MKRCKKCSKFYNEKISNNCPYCSGNTISSVDEENDIFPHIDDEDKTMAYNIEKKENLENETTTFPKVDEPDIIKNDNEVVDSNKTVVILTKSKSKALNIEPVVGWLVIVEGEGLGSDLKIVAGMNTIGRGSNNKIVIDYGDNTISNDHAIVIYDYRNNLFFFQHGGGINLSYINDNVILQPVELKNGDEIRLGNTKLIFVSFCNEKFTWNTNKDKHS